MKFLLMMAEEDHYDRWDASDDAHKARVYADFEAFDRAVAERGKVVGGEVLTRADGAQRVGPGPGRAVTDGPFAETVEQIGGFYVIDVPDLATAVELAKLLPAEYTVEVREVLDMEG